MDIHHIAGHHDKKNTTLSMEGELNVKADQLAAIGRKKKNVKPVLLPGNKPYLLINNKQVTSKHSKLLRDSFHTSRMHKYFKDGQTKKLIKFGGMLMEKHLRNSHVVKKQRYKNLFTNG
jgi:hypothetical protein